MKRTIPVFFLFCIAAACQQNPNSPAPDSSTKDSATVSQTPESDSIADSKTNAASCTFTWQELAEMEQRWSGSQPDKFLSEKGFRVVFNLPFSNGHMTFYEKAGTSERLEISDVDYDTGDHAFDVNYYIPSEAGYNSFTGELQTSTFKYNKRKNRYETFISTYEESFFVLHNKVVEKERTGYRVQYSHTTGKELSVPELPANDAVQK